MADILVDLGHGRNAGASAKGDATLATFLVVVSAAFQQKAPYSLQNRRSTEVAERCPKSQAQGPNKARRRTTARLLERPLDSIRRVGAIGEYKNIAVSPFGRFILLAKPSA